MRLRRHRTIHFKEVAELPPDDEEMRLFDMELDIYAVLEALEGRLTGRNLDDTLVGDGLSFTEQTLTTPKQLQLDSSFSPTFAGLTVDSLTVGDWTVDVDSANPERLQFTYQDTDVIFHVWDDSVVFGASLTRLAGTVPSIGTASLPFGDAYLDEVRGSTFWGNAAQFEDAVGDNTPTIRLNGSDAQIDLAVDAEIRFFDGSDVLTDTSDTTITRKAAGAVMIGDGTASNLRDLRARRVGDEDGDTYMDSGEGGDTDQLTFVAAGTAAFRVEDGAVDYLYSLTAADSTTPTHINLPTGGTAAQAGWLTVKVNGTISYLPVWQ